METFLQQERQNAIQNSKLASLGEMAAGIAHDINNPLAVIQANAFLLPRIKGDEQKFTDRLGAMTKATERIAKIVKGLRKFSRSTEGAEHRPERVTDIVNECLVLTEAKAKRHSVTIDAKLESQKQILCDQVEIEQVLVNLINNAIDAVSELPERWVVVSSLDEGDEVLIRVMDSGKGVPAEVEDKIFQPFFTTKSVGQGTGLGLSIARGILEQHGATLMLNRSLGHTCFEIRFKKKDA
jgi:C4-dicarboxylate-specific signal transduction histidine kinase